MQTIEGHDVKIFTDNIEKTAMEQIKELLAIDVFSDKKIRIMPDVHAGAGCVIGFTGNLGDKVIPNIVGVDIGCGMRIINLGKLTRIDFHSFNEHIRRNIPAGMCVRDEQSGFSALAGEETEIFNEARMLVAGLGCFRELRNIDRIYNSVGTLGGGNHFIELDTDDDGNVYLVIHTGSRNLGKQVADLYQAKAVRHLTVGGDEMRKMRRKAKPLLPAPLCYVEGELRDRYLHDMRLCQRWAILNRRLISLLLLKFFQKDKNAAGLTWFESVHN